MSETRFGRPPKEAAWSGRQLRSVIRATLEWRYAGWGWMATAAHVNKVCRSIRVTHNSLPGILERAGIPDPQEAMTVDDIVSLQHGRRSTSARKALRQRRRADRFH